MFSNTSYRSEYIQHAENSDFTSIIIIISLLALALVGFIVFGIYDGRQDYLKSLQKEQEEKSSVEIESSSIKSASIEIEMQVFKDHNVESMYY